MQTTSDFKPAFWLTNPHAQTLFASQMRFMPPLAARTERLELEDGDFLDLSWLAEPVVADEAPVVVVLHGLNGSLESKYARGLLARCAEHGARGVLMHFRGASQPNRLARSYHSGETGDFEHVLALIRARYPRAPIAAVGYSLGGNVLLKYLGEQGKASPLACAVAVSVPYDLKICAEAVQHGLSRIYQSYLLGGMREIVTAKIERGLFDDALPDLASLTDFPSFDNAITAPLNGFRDAEEYYAHASSRGYLRGVATPTLILHARDDPFMSPAVIPTADELSDAIRFELSERGGHVGFVRAGRFGAPAYWLEERIPSYLRGRLPGFEPLPNDAPAGAPG